MSSLYEFLLGRLPSIDIVFSGKERNLNIVELLCANCSRWVHETCVSYQLGKGKLLPFITNYVFVCKNCSASGLESFRKSQASKCNEAPQIYPS